MLETLAETLPECQVRYLAYATFAALHVIDGREAHLVEYDGEPLILVRDTDPRFPIAPTIGCSDRRLAGL